jgi:hypothetical protein
MPTLLRRFLVYVALMFWLGGFTFYAAVVVPVGQDVLGSHRKQGFITREVTNYLNLSGAIALLPLAWDVVGGTDSSRWRRQVRWLGWLGLLFTLGWLVWLHGQLESLLDLESRTILDGSSFRTDHRVYLWVSTVQWAFGLGYTALTLQAWRAEDRVAACDWEKQKSA